MLEFITSTPFIVIYICYSVVGWLYLTKYFAECLAVRAPTFGNSLTAMIAMGILCGGITTMILIYTFIKALVITIKSAKN